jgi:hypothetical protein
MRVALIVLVLLASTLARAERRRNSLSNDICVLAVVETDEGRAELVPFVSTSFGGGLDTYRSVGGVARLHFADGWVMEMEAQKRSADRRLDLPMSVLQARRLGGGALTVGLTPFVGRFLVTDTWLVNFDVVASAGAGIEFVRAPQATEFEDRFALTASVTMRFRIHPWLSLDIGLHDEWVPVGDTPSRTTARATDQPVVMPATTHEFEVRAGLGFWIPDAPGRTCRRHCS